MSKIDKTLHFDTPFIYIYIWYFQYIVFLLLSPLGKVYASRRIYAYNKGKKKPVKKLLFKTAKF